LPTTRYYPASKSAIVDYALAECDDLRTTDGGGKVNEAALKDLLCFAVALNLKSKGAEVPTSTQ
jgi:hypothetical protein